MVSAQGGPIRKEHPPVDALPSALERATLLAAEFAARAARHDRDASFPFENFNELSEAGLLALTVPAALGGCGAGALDAARIINILGKADPSTALVLSMHYIQHLVMARSTRWPGRLSRKLARETVEGVALVNALRVEPDLGSPSRGGLPATTARAGTSLSTTAPAATIAIVPIRSPGRIVALAPIEASSSITVSG